MMFLQFMNLCFAAITLTLVNSLPAQKPVDVAEDLGVKEARKYSYNSKHGHQLISYFLNSYSNFDSNARTLQIKQSLNVSDNLTNTDVHGDLAKSDVGDYLIESDVNDNPTKSNVSDSWIKSDVGDNITKPDVGDNLTKLNVGDNFTKIKIMDDLTKLNIGDNLTKPHFGDNVTKPDVGYNVTKPDVSDNSTKPYGDNLTKLDVSDNITKPDGDNINKSEDSDILTKLDVGDNLTVANVSEKLTTPNFIDNLTEPEGDDNLTQPVVGENLTKSNVSDNLSNADIYDILKPTQSKPDNDHISEMVATTDKEELVVISENSEVITEKTPTILELLMMSKGNKTKDYEREVYAALQEKWKNAKVVPSNTVGVSDSELDENAEEIREMEMNEINDLKKDEEKQVEVTEDLPEGEAVPSGEDATEQEAENRSDSQSRGLISYIMNYLFSF